jgi:hypothetical protein
LRCVVVMMGGTPPRLTSSLLFVEPLISTSQPKLRV